ncbi:hypothetical protein V2595_04005, partial [Tenacibaculum maritimum]
AVSFTNIRINTDYQLIEGVVSTTYDTTWGDVESVDEEVEDMEDLIDDIFGEDTTEESNVDTDDVINDTTTGENTNTNTNDTDNSNTDTSNNSSSDSSTTNTTDTTNSNSGINTTTDTDSNTEETNIGSEKSSRKYITYRGTKYYKDDTITIDYDNSIGKEEIEFFGAKEKARIQFNAFTKDYPEGTGQYIVEGKKVNYLVQKDIISYQLAVIFWDIPEDFPSEDKMARFLVNIKINKPKFKFKELWASDANNTDRLAKSGEVLYLVKAKGIRKLNSRTRRVNYSVTTTPSLKTNNFVKNDLVWNYYDINGRKNNEYGKININRPLWERDLAHTTSVDVGYPNKETKSIDVKFVDGQVVKFDFMPPAMNHIIKETMGTIENNLKILDKINKTLGLKDKTKFKIEPVKISSKRENKEISNSRLYKTEEKGNIAAGVKAELAKKTITHPAFEVLKRTGIFEAGLYFLFNIQVKLKGGIDREKLAEQENYRGQELYAEIYAKGCIQAGLMAELLVVKEQVEFEAKGFIEACLQGGLRYNFRKEQFQGKMFIPPVILGAQIKAKSKGVLKFDLVDWKGSVEISDQIPIK